MSISTASCNAPRRPELVFAGIQGISQPRPAYVPGRSTRHRSFLRSVQNLPTPEQEIAELVADIDGVPVIVRILVKDLSAVPSDLASKVDLSAKLSNLLEKMVEKMWGTSLESGHEPKQALASAEHLARPPTLSNDTLLRVGPLELDLLDRTARRGDRRIKLRPREFQLLKYMMQRADQLLTRAALLKEVWNYKFVPQTNLVDVHMGRLRRKIDELHESALIRNVRGVGFVLSATPFLK